jgi:hypothetical protein
MFDILWTVLQWAVASLALSLAIGHVFAVSESGAEPSTTMRARRPVRKMAPPEERMAAVVRPAAYMRMHRAGEAGALRPAIRPRPARPARQGH